MAERVARQAELSFTSVGKAEAERSSANDSRRAALALQKAKVDILVFVGGDGTARDIYTAVGDNFPVLGLPAGVKMHSGVYAVSPEAAAEIIVALASGQLVDLRLGEVRDIDERAFLQGQVRALHYGELQVPALGGFLQQTKVAGREVEELAVADIAAEIVETMDPECLYLIGPGTTTAAIMAELALENTLLGFDAVCGGLLRGRDLSEADMSALLDEHCGPVSVIITAIGGQGHILGRGNQQLSPALIRRIGRAHFQIVATKSKITELQGRPLLVDSDDPLLDSDWAGFIRVVTGYRDAVMYRVGGAG